MKNLQFVWDINKEVQNIKKHKISFKDAQTVFYDDNARLIYDPDHSETEDRFILLGLNKSIDILVVCHCYKENDEIIRIISARKATKKEQLDYWRNIK